MGDYKYRMWYSTPAENEYYHGLPIGNGKIGGMIYGNPVTDILHINECTIWTGSPHEDSFPEQRISFDELRRRQLAYNYNQDNDWVSNMICRDVPFANNYHHGQVFQYAGQVEMCFGHENYDSESYMRELDLSNAIAFCRYKVGNVLYTKECFASYKANVIACKITASESFDFSVYINSDMKGKASVEGNEVIFGGITDDRKGIEGKLEFRLVARVIPNGGTLYQNGSSLSVKGAESCLVLITVTTNYIDPKTLGGDYRGKAKYILDAAQTKGYNCLKQEHIEDYRSIFDKVQIDFGEDLSTEPTDKRIRDFCINEDPSLIALYMEFNRYLLISSSREGGTPANLQGIWNNTKNPPWDSKYTTNINLQMNYWPAYIANLDACAKPFIKKITGLTESGKLSARTLYNIEKGWVLHHNTDLWDMTMPVDGPWGMTPTCGAWLACQLFDQYLFTMDNDYLLSIYDTLKGAAEFLLSFLTEYMDESGKTYLVTCPSTSPENMQKSTNQYISFGSAFDNQIIHQLFSDMIYAARALNQDRDFACVVEKAKEMLPPCVNIGRWGQVQEFFFHDYDEPNDTHRHISHLVGVYPFDTVDIQKEEIRKAVETSLAARTKPGDWTGWGIGWRIGQYARLSDSKNAYRMLKIIFDTANRMIYPNLMGGYPLGDSKVFQIDGNFGTLAGLCEILVSSSYNRIKLLPALPGKWDSGSVSGLRARGGFDITDLVWKNSVLEKVSVYSLAGEVLNISYRDKSVSIETQKDTSYTFDGELNYIN